jgi:hypothetical protein
VYVLEIQKIKKYKTFEDTVFYNSSTQSLLQASWVLNEDGRIQAMNHRCDEPDLTCILKSKRVLIPGLTPGLTPEFKYPIYT